MDQPLASSSAPSPGSTSAAPPPPRALPAQDQLTLSQLKRGHWSVMEDLVRRYQDRLFAAVLRIVGHPEDAADLVQETFVRAMQNVAKFEGKSTLYTWLFRIAINLSLSHRRAQRYRTAASLDNSPHEGGEDLNQQAASLRRQLSQTTELDPAAAAEIHIEHEKLLEALAKLEPDFRAIIVLRDVEDCDYEQIAEILELPVGTVKSRLFRARAALREAFSPANDRRPNPRCPQMKDYGEELESRIAAYIDGQLPPAEAARLEVFLANSDPALARQVVDMIAERNAVRSLPKPHAPEDLAARIMEQVERTSLLNDSEHFTAPHRPWWQSRLAVAAALFLILGGFSWFILEAVRRPDSSWRETVMEESPRRDENRDLAAAQKTLPPVPPAGIASAPSPTAIASAGAEGGAAPQKSAALPAAAAPDVPAAVTAAQQSAATLAEKTQATPIQITLVARTPDDEARLRAELARFSDANPATANQVAPLNTTTDNQSNIAGNGISPTQGQQNNSNATEQLAARSAERAQSRRNAGNYQSYDTNRRAFNIPTESRAAQNETPAQTTLPYRIALRPDQLRRLTTDFQLQSEKPLSDALAPTAAFGATATPATQPQSAAKDISTLLADKSADTLIDCIITLLPPTTPASSSTTAPASTPPAASVPPPNSPPTTEPR